MTGGISESSEMENCPAPGGSGNPQGRVVWITGLSGAGKTTLAKALRERLRESILLDGDELRAALGAEKHGFNAQSRKKLALTYARLAAMLANQGFIVLVATISMFHEVHAWNRQNMPGYLEIFLDVAEDERRRRDPKGLYAAEQKGQVPDMAGISARVETPKNPHLRLTGQESLEQSVDKVMRLIEKEIS